MLSVLIFRQNRASALRWMRLLCCGEFDGIGGKADFYATNHAVNTRFSICVGGFPKQIFILNCTDRSPTRNSLEENGVLFIRKARIAHNLL